MAGVSDLSYDVDNENLEQFSDYTNSDSYSSSSSCTSQSDDDYEPIWLEKVGSRGSLFYIEPDLSFNTTTSYNSPECSATDEDLYEKKQTKSKFNAAEKLQKWLRKRRKKVRKSFPLLDFNCNPEENEALLFRSNTKEIFVDIDSSQQYSEHNSSLSEKLLGLTFKTNIKSFGKLKEDLIISAFTSVKDVYMVNNIKLGDSLKSINDTEVTMMNIDDVLSRLIAPSKVKLTIEGSLNLPSKFSTFKQPSESPWLMLGSPSILEDSAGLWENVPHGVAYLSIDNDLVVEKDGVVYRYPDDETPLFQQKGMFITLAHMIADVASPPLLNCSLVVQEEMVHVGYVKEEKEVMILVLPDSCATVCEVQHFTTDIAKLLKFQFSSLGKAFSDRNARQMNHFFAMFFHRLLSEAPNPKHNSAPLPHLISILPSVHWMPLPTDLKTEIDDVLSELESSDFGSSSKGFYGNQRIFSLRGSCLFHKGCLLSSHLPKSDLLDIHLYLQHHNLLHLDHSVSELIIWREVFLSTLVHGRGFMLIVAMGYTVLAVLLEAGGCSLRIEGVASPEPFYVEEVQNTLIILEECGIIDAINKMFDAMLPSLASPKHFVKECGSGWASLSSLFGSHRTARTDITGLRKSSESRLIDRSDEIDLKRQQILSSMGPADGESDVESDDSSDNLQYPQKSSRSHSISTGSTSGSLGSSEYMASQVYRQSFSSSFNASSSWTGDRDRLLLNKSSINVVAGEENTLFQYLHMDPVEGVFLSPLPTHYGEPLHGEVVLNFYRCCLTMRKAFERSLRNQEIKKSGINTKFGINDFLQAAYEQGILFQCTIKDSQKHKNAASVLNFWVIGRLFFSPEPREIYVCYHDSAQQDMVEIAFRLGFGLSL